MGKSVAGAMTFEDVRMGAPAKSTVRKEAKRLRELDINKMSDGAIIWHLVKKHKFGLVTTAFIVWVAFDMFGTLIIGLVESLFK